MDKHQHSQSAVHQSRFESSHSRDRFIPSRKERNFICDDTPRSESTAYTHYLKHIQQSQQRPTFDEHEHISNKHQARPLSVKDICTGAGMPSHNPFAKRNICLHKHWDVPGLANDYYNDVMDWASTDHLCIAISDKVILTSQNGEVNPITRQPVKTRRQHFQEIVVNNSFVTALKLHPRQLLAAAGTDTGHLEIYELEKFTHLRLWRISSKRINCMAWYGNQAVCGGVDGKISICDLKEKVTDKQKLVVTPETQICGLAIRGNYLAAGSQDQKVRIWDIRLQEKPVYVLEGYKATIKTLAWCPWKENVLATGAGRQDGRVVIWNTLDAPYVMSKVKTKSALSTVVWNQKFRELVTSHGRSSNESSPYESGKMGWINIWQRFNLTKPKTTIEAHKRRILKVCLNPNEDQMASIGADDALKFWKLNARPEDIVRTPRSFMR